MIKKFLLSGFGVCLLASGGLAQAGTVDLYGYSLNIDGAVSDVTDAYDPLDPVPAGVNVSGFNDVTGLGEIIITVGGAGAHWVLSFFDHELDELVNGFTNEYGGTDGVAASGQSWEIDEPGYFAPFGDIYDNFFDNTLDNINALTANLLNDVSMAMGWNFVLAADETAWITFTVAELAPDTGFYLGHVDADSGMSIYLSSMLNIRGTSVPEPGTLWLMGAGLLSLGLMRRRNLTDS